MSEDLKAGDRVCWRCDDSGDRANGVVVSVYGTCVVIDGRLMRHGRHSIEKSRGTITPLPQDQGGPARCVAQGCFRYSAGGSCPRCGYPVAFVHPNCVSDALAMDAVYVYGTAMIVKGSSDVPFGVVNVVERDAFSKQQYLIPRHLQPGDLVTWRPSSGSPLAQWIVHGLVDTIRSALYRLIVPDALEGD